jgi:hypothetical protein
MKVEYLNMRVHPEQKKRWGEAQQRDRFPDLSSWVRAKLDEAAGVAPGEYTEANIPVVVDDTVPPGVAEFRDGEKVVVRVENLLESRSPVARDWEDDIEIPQPALQRLAIEPKPERPVAERLAKDCVNENMHWRLRKGEPCTYCKGVA